MQKRYWDTERLCNLAACLRAIATPTDDGRLAIRGTQGLGRMVAPKYWSQHDEDAQLAHIMKALSGLSAAGVLDTSGAKVHGQAPIRYIHPDRSEEHTS